MSPEILKLINENTHGLDRLPIPSLDDTCERYLKSAKPLLSEADYAAHEKLVNEFKTTVGPELQELLVAGDKHEGYPHSFIERDWDLMYNELRCTTPVNVSPYFGITDEKDPSKQNQIGRAATFISGFTRWTRKLLDGTFEPDKGACSSAFAPMFATAKVPKAGCDILEWHQDSKHVVILCNGHIFTLQVLSADNTILDVAGIEAKLKEIVSQSKEAASPSTAVQLLTSDERPVWVTAREQLMSANADALKAVDAGLLVVCLDAAPSSADPTVEKCTRLLIGDGMNRWWDKQQLIVDGSGGMGMTFEHSYSDGTIWGRLIREVMCASDGADSGVAPLPTLPTHTAADAPAPEKVIFSVPAAVEGSIAAAAQNYAKLQSNMGLAALDFKDFGKNEFKTWGCSPDAVVQLAFQCAYYKMHGKPPPVYEACATRKFFHGRTETIRSCTEHSTALAKAFASGKATAEMVQEAAKTHGAISKAAAGGSGYDRHLYALASIASQKNMSVELFSNPVFTGTKTWLLSTSNGSQPYLDLFGFGPTTPECYGLGYLIGGNAVSVAVSSFKDATMNSSPKMAAAIADTLREMQKLFKK
ncbi:hypothetical protein CYMTET_38235 [Cymbomonas tetramitiformis]|uniref:Choline/carnitine acyltransferase domain-containing protein n=1 Tax=Cymbomonas tetramitiformis TaxID=36881 RepID=A0AAE0F5W1_9CHLO|nr:hypothetical protein CYMTET_38235 [Cymbomonas tetramitiformis]|eukprot:gene16267-19302_t